MTPRPGLHAEQRTDRNGRTVTRWVKDAPAAGASRKLPGTPPAPRRSKREVTIGALAKKIAKDSDFDHPGQQAGYERDMARKLGTLKDETLEAMRNAVSSGSIYPADLRNLVYDLREDEELRPLLAYCEAFHPDTDWNTEADLASALAGYPVFRDAGDPAGFTGDLRRVAEALLRVGSAIAVYCDKGLLHNHRISDEKLYRMIVEDPSIADSLVALVEDRETISGELAEVWLQTQNPLRGGAL